MKRFIILILITICLVFSCGPTYILTNNFDNKLRTIEQVDSIKRIERLPISWEKYKSVVMMTETSSFEQYIYIRRTDSTEVVYRRTD